MLVKTILQKSHLLKAHTLTISMTLTQESITLLNNLRKSRSLKFLTILKIGDEGNMEHEPFLNKLKYLNLEKVEIQTYIYEKPRFENNHWYHEEIKHVKFPSARELVRELMAGIV